MTATRKKRGTAFVTLDIEESITVLFALKRYIDLQKMFPRRAPEGEVDLLDVTQTLHDRIETRVDTVRGAR